MGDAHAHGAVCVGGEGGVLVSFPMVHARPLSQPLMSAVAVCGVWRWAQVRAAPSEALHPLPSP